MMLSHIKSFLSGALDVIINAFLLPIVTFKACFYGTVGLLIVIAFPLHLVSSATWITAFYQWCLTCWIGIGAFWLGLMLSMLIAALLFDINTLFSNAPRALVSHRPTMLFLHYALSLGLTVLEVYLFVSYIPSKYALTKGLAILKMGPDTHTFAQMLMNYSYFLFPPVAGYTKMKSTGRESDGDAVETMFSPD